MNAQRIMVVFSVLTLVGYVCVADILPGPKLTQGEKLVERQSTAVAIAHAVAVERYGVEVVEAQMPLTAERNGETWVVNGVLPEGVPGGVLDIWVSAIDGRIIKIQHEQ